MRHVLWQSVILFVIDVALLDSARSSHASKNMPSPLPEFRVDSNGGWRRLLSNEKLGHVFRVEHSPTARLYCCLDNREHVDFEGSQPFLHRLSVSDVVTLFLAS